MIENAQVISQTHPVEVSALAADSTADEGLELLDSSNYSH